ncbi:MULTISPECIES: hypothetical protein [unclassified Methylobacterium]|uniref:hypothetical protein n=1 Tax=unclassified Methylobacterium TaxID=2615210 RepID=UPI000CB1ED48|nr:MULTISPECIES: hypothetical protein [unclassified Methylobacterium]PIU06654.1 MAG: hypothetical protein COT56_08455 [Methylobacterium sp. CG09_land_8_20_14_0_10_71_15]PIU12086.1 MAG: hypothetical protein COT28_16790 [Methylobacterium sp. CG08_land_8_20_14_0_20_71_15]
MELLVARVIPAEFQAILKASIAETASLVRVTGVLPTPQGPRVQWELSGPPDPADTKLTEAELRDVAEAASRYLAVRWRDSAEPWPVPPQHWDILSKLHPRIYDVSIETGPGWHWLLVMTAEWMSEGGLPSNFKTAQVKEKFGGLRFYHDGTRRTLRIARAAEQLSFGVCEICGTPGRLRKGGWTRTLCDEHDPKQR